MFRVFFHEGQILTIQCFVSIYTIALDRVGYVTNILWLIELDGTNSLVCLSSPSRYLVL